MARRKPFRIALVFLLSAAALILLTISAWQRVEIAALRTEIAEVNSQRRSLLSETETLRSQVEDAEERVAMFEAQREAEIDQSRYGSLPAGMSRAEADERIVEDLLGRGTIIIEETIGAEAVLGGTMGFYSPDNIEVLNDRWVLAWFEDGHIGGEALLRYRFTEDGSIEWSLVEITDY